MNPKDRKAELAENLARVRAQVDAAAQSAGRDPSEVRLLPVTKFHPASDVALLGELGVTEVAENREQEARGKAAEVPGMRFHMIGQIQTKKANAVARWAAAVHSVDSEKLARALDRGAALALERGERGAETLPIPIYLQLSLDGDAYRGGVSREAMPALIDVVLALDHLKLVGIMCVPPVGVDADAAFAEAATVREEASRHAGRPMELSAGMSGDFATAIAHGSTVVRVGTSILGQRPVA